MYNFKVTTIDNFDESTRSFKNPSLIGTCFKVENIQSTKLNEEAQAIETTLITLCTVAWDNQGPFYPAVITYAANDLVFVSGESELEKQVKNLSEHTALLYQKLEELEDVVFEEDEDEEESEELVNN